MFDGLTAWFSASVGKSKKKIWISCLDHDSNKNDQRDDDCTEQDGETHTSRDERLTENETSSKDLDFKMVEPKKKKFMHMFQEGWKCDGGGQETDFDSAMFIFSQDAQADDTKEIYECQAYLDEHLAVFHPNFISQCWKTGDVKAVAVGKYFLPPKEIQQLVKKQMTFEWEIDGNMSDGSTDVVAKTKKRDFVAQSQVTASENSTTANIEKPSASSHGKEANGVWRIEDLPKITGPLKDFIPGEGGHEIFHKKRTKTN